MILGDDDGKYRPEDRNFRTAETIATTAYARAVPTTTKIPYYGYVDPRYDWNSRRHWAGDRHDPRYDTRYEGRYDTRYNPNSE